jgi:ABC-type Mn2+/Zn2+ transport system permease subunit
MPVVSYHVGFLSGLLAPFATLRSLLEAGGSTSKTLIPGALALAVSTTYLLP